eukprot:scaffold315324_cov37-Tisochrysis_lutea.AAC.1
MVWGSMISPGGTQWATLGYVPRNDLGGQSGTHHGVQICVPAGDWGRIHNACRLTLWERAVDHPPMMTPGLRTSCAHRNLLQGDGNALIPLFETALATIWLGKANGHRCCAVVA